MLGNLVLFKHGSRQARLRVAWRPRAQVARQLARAPIAMSGPGVLQSCGVVGPSDVPAPRPGIYALQALKSRSESGVAPLLSTPVASSPLQAEPKDTTIDELEALLRREEHAQRGWPASTPQLWAPMTPGGEHLASDSPQIRPGRRAFLKLLKA